MQEGAHATPARVHGPPGRDGGQHARRLGPRLPLGVGRAGVAALTTGTPGVWPGAVLPGRLFPRATPGNNAAPSSPTVAVSCGPQLDRPPRDTKRGLWPV